MQPKTVVQLFWADYEKGDLDTPNRVIAWNRMTG